jgi:hypothetical protein
MQVLTVWIPFWPFELNIDKEHGMPALMHPARWLQSRKHGSQPKPFVTPLGPQLKQLAACSELTK